MEWFNPPRQWRADGGAITVTTSPKTDFWRTTHYGFIRDDGHFYYQDVTGNFTLKAKISGAYRDLYDQAGLMIRIDESNWMKCGVELVEGVQQASAVVTREYSDWSVIPLSSNPASIWFNVKRSGDALEVFYSLNGTNYTMLRLAYFPPVATVKAGLMCASPTGSGFEVAFEDVELSAASA